MAASMRFLLHGATLLAILRCCLAAASKEVVANILCAVCKQAVKEASLRAKDAGVEDEDALTDAIDNLCSAKKDEGKWTTKIDVVRKPSGLGLDRRDDEGKCNNECKLVQQACTKSLKGREESLVSSIKEGAGIGKLQREICKKPCSKSVPELGQWQDEAFEPVKPSMPDPPTPPPTQSEGKPLSNVTAEEFVSLSFDMISAALMEFDGIATSSDVKACFKVSLEGRESDGDVAASVATAFQGNATTAISGMLRKDVAAMRMGLALFGATVARLAEAMEPLCEKMATSAARMKAQGTKLKEYCKDEHASSFEYEPMKTLKVHGYDIHKLLNTCIGAWTRSPADSRAFGSSFGKLLKVFEAEVDASGKPKAEL